MPTDQGQLHLGGLVIPRTRLHGSAVRQGHSLATAASDDLDRDGHVVAAVAGRGNVGIADGSAREIMDLNAYGF